MTKDEKGSFKLPFSLLFFKIFCEYVILFFVVVMVFGFLCFGTNKFLKDIKEINRDHA